MRRHFLLGQTTRLSRKHPEQLDERRERTLLTYLGTRVMPFISVLPPHPARFKPPTSGSYCRRGCDWDSHSTEQQAMRKPSQAAN